MKISPLDAADQERLREKRSIVEQYLIPGGSKETYKNAVGKLGAIHEILESEVFKQEQTYENQCLGIVLGDAFVQELGMEWIIVEDDHQRTPAIQLPSTSLVLFPPTMISDLVQRGAKFDVFELFDGVARMVKEFQASER